MWFPAALVASTLITIGLIFGVYKVFLDKPQTEIVQPTPTASVRELEISSLPVTSPTPKPKPSALPRQPSATPKGVIGSITVLQNNTASQSYLGSSTISGTVDITGTPPSSSSLVMVARKTGTADQFKTVVDGITAQDNASWAWNNSQSGITYDIVAVLKGSSNGIDTDYAQSQTYTIKSPAFLQLITLDVGYAMSAPTGAITVSCNTHYSNNTWAAVVNFPQVTGALMYWLQIGSTSGGNDIANIPKNAQTQEVTLTDSVNYFAQYAVAPVSNPTSAQYSAFSSPTTIKCP